MQKTIGAWISADCIVRVSVRRGDGHGGRGKVTTISMDDMLFHALADQAGGTDAAVQWIRNAALAIPRLHATGDKVVTIYKNAGLSRLVQRLVLQRLLTGDDFGLGSGTTEMSKK
jgi:hypothetical protein